MLEGGYVVEVGGELVRLEAGDCVLGPRNVPHAWSFVGEDRGRLLLSFAPANRMETFFRERESRGIKPGEYSSTPEDAAIIRDYGLELVGPPLTPREWATARRPA